MTSAADAVEVRRVEAGVAEMPSSVADFVTLLKLRVMSLVVFTAFAGMVTAPAELHPVLAAIALIAIGVGAGAAGALNMWYDADIDAKMTRTASRPLPAGRIRPESALAFGAVLALFAVMTLAFASNYLAAGLLAFTIFFYAIVYTMGLKRRTAQNIVIGGAAGALPPVIGWAAMSGAVTLEPVLLFLVIFLWTPPHFWALALLKAEEYGRAGVPMLPVTAGPAATRRQILLYTVLTVAAGISLWPLGLAGPLYGLAATALGAVFLRAAWRVYAVGDGPGGRRASGRLFGLSIHYLFALFAVLMIDHVAVLIAG
jgi:protoheme IX farnesyltransferase